MRAAGLLLGLGLIGCGGSPWKAVDGDGDGVSVAEGDCWDRAEGPAGSGLSGADIRPEAEERWYDGVDQDCAGDDDYDADRDGYLPEGDWGQASTLGLDAFEHQEGVDCWDAPDAMGTDADHAPLNELPPLLPSAVHPGAEDAPYDGVDADCAGGDEFDVDGDGYASASYADEGGAVGDDCEDADPDLSPGAVESCDGQDNNCDGLIDDEDPEVDLSGVDPVFEDADGDGFGTPGEGLLACEAPTGWVPDDSDCDDSRAHVHPAEAETLCDGWDDDCDGDVDEDVLSDWFVDSDGDGYGDPGTVEAACAPSDGLVGEGGDCDDEDPAVHPDTDELCATVGVDDNCDGEADEATAADVPTWYLDADEDGHGDLSSPADSCETPDGHVASSDDCDDSDALVSPDAQEVCGGGDEDCDGLVDDDDGSVLGTSESSWYADADSDGYGSGAASRSCLAPAGHVALNGDCAPSNPARHPGATETCNDVDDDCDSLTDDADSAVTGTSTWYEDADDDGYGDPATADDYCEAPAGFVADNRDCDDSDGDVNPGELELCNDGLDNDCSGDLGDRGPEALAEECRLQSLDLSEANRVWSGTADGQLGASMAVLEQGGALPALSMAAPYEDTLDTSSKAAGGMIYTVTSAASGLGLDEVDEGAYGLPRLGGRDASDHAALAMAAGDLDGDGVDELILGLPHAKDGGETSEGELNIRLDPSTTLDRLESGSGQNDVAGSYFGFALDLRGDIDDDGRADLLVGAPETSTLAYQTSLTYTGNGYAQVYLDSDLADGTAGTARFTFTGAGSTDALGVDVAWIDGDSDGVSDALLGAPYADAGGGEVYLLDVPATLGGTASVSTASALFTGAAAGQLAGLSLATGGDVDGDGHEDLLIGGPHTTGTGMAWLFLGPWDLDGSVTVIEDLTAADATISGLLAGDRTGHSVSILQDSDGDGDDEVLVGGWKVTTGAGQTGAVGLFAGPLSGTWSLDGGQALYAGEAAGDRAGWTVDGGHDLNDDGYGDILVGATYASDGTTNDGKVYLILGLGE